MLNNAQLDYANFTQCTCKPAPTSSTLATLRRYTLGRLIYEGTADFSVSTDDAVNP
jgi:hypothetical protein